MGEENRQYNRIKINRKIFIRQSNGEVVTATACDISLGGVGLICEYGCDVGQQFEVSVNLTGNPKLGPIQAKAQVRFVNLIGGIDSYRIGLEFLQFKGQSQSVLEHYIEMRKAQPTWV
ncbi:MAG: PilZ domain-containing protein [Gammaproteobacteria bacterium]|nr:MAG: PilZ domain-containing protein [Gammaproteobacteria bacterium]